MNKRQLITFPNQLLKQVCKPVAFPLTEETLENIFQLKNTFRESFITNKIRTLGLAAPQIGVLQRFLIIPRSINYPDVKVQVLKTVVKNFKVYLNPTITEYSEQKVFMDENCLSMSNDQIYAVQRSENIRIEYFNVDGEKIEQKLSGIRARVFLHQYDHLDGITMDDRGTLKKKQQTK